MIEIKADIDSTYRKYYVFFLFTRYSINYFSKTSVTKSRRFIRSKAVCIQAQFHSCSPNLVVHEEATSLTTLHVFLLQIDSSRIKNVKDCWLVVLQHALPSIPFRLSSVSDSWFILHRHKPFSCSPSKVILNKHSSFEQSKCLQFIFEHGSCFMSIMSAVLLAFCARNIWCGDELFSAI